MIDAVTGIYLVGLRGVGKTALGKSVAEQLAFDFHDTDEQLSEQEGRPVGDFLADVGEPSFRDAESELMFDLVHELMAGRQVLSLGGGTPEAPGVEDVLQELRLDHGWVGVWVLADPAEQLARIEKGTDPRPPLVGRNRAEENRILLARRAKLYGRVTDVRFLNRDGDLLDRTVELTDAISRFLGYGY